MSEWQNSLSLAKTDNHCWAASPYGAVGGCGALLGMSGAEIQPVWTSNINVSKLLKKKKICGGNKWEKDKKRIKRKGLIVSGVILMS